MLENDPILVTFRGNRKSAGLRDLLQHVKASHLPNLAILCESGEESLPSVSICARGTCYPPASDPAELAGILLQLSLHTSAASKERS